MSLEAAILEAYLPAQLDDDELAALVARVVAELGASGPRDMGRVMKAVVAEAAGRADGGRVAPLVTAALARS